MPAADFLRDQGIMKAEDTMYIEVPVHVAPLEVEESEDSEPDVEAVPVTIQAQQRTPPSSPHVSPSTTLVSTSSWSLLGESPTDKKGKKPLSRVSSSSSLLEIPAALTFVAAIRVQTRA